MKIPVSTRLAAPILAIGLFTACAATGVPPGPSNDPDSEASASESAATRPPVATIGPGQSEPPVDGPADVPDDVWAAVIEALDARLDGAVDASAVELVSVEAVTWNDGSLGCPKPGEVYTQALVDGFQVVVEVDGERYDYRSAGGDSVRLCGSPIEGG